jgi:hypothetical protein
LVTNWLVSVLCRTLNRLMILIRIFSVDRSGNKHYCKTTVS